MLIYNEPLASASASSDNGLPSIGPSSISAVIVPVYITPYIGEQYLKNVTTMGQFSLGLLRCVSSTVASSISGTFMEYEIESDAMSKAEISAVPVVLV
jgi:hypothetical protein